MATVRGQSHAERAAAPAAQDAAPSGSIGDHAASEVCFSSRSSTHHELSNFHPFGAEQDTVEALYQAAKVEFLGSPALARRIRAQTNPVIAKRMGGKTHCCAAMAAELGITRAEMARRNNLRIRAFRSFEVMKQLLTVKFADSEMRAALLATGDATLHEVGRGRTSPWIRSGGDMLGKLLMEVRAEIRESMREEAAKGGDQLGREGTVQMTGSQSPMVSERKRRKVA
jgi:predicted NAD-dependent protein-ADP-ribosyltransferase YbiA (DUF1768 family)